MLRERFHKYIFDVVGINCFLCANYIAVLWGYLTALLLRTTLTVPQGNGKRIQKKVKYYGICILS